jgi:internalin A
MDGDLSWLTEHDRLTFLNIECPGISDLAPVAEMPQLGNLHLYSLPAGLDLRCLTRLTGLTGLTLFGENMDAGLGDLAGALPKLRRLAVGAGWRCSVEVLKRFRPLEYLGLYFGPTPPNGLRDVVDALPDLRQLDLCYCPWVGDLTPLADLTQLDSLSLRQAKTGDYSPLGAVSGLRRLLLGNCERIDGLAEIARLPRLRHLELSELQTEVDLSPLAGCRLTLVMSGQFSVTGIDRLGRGVKIIDRRSRVS